MYIKRDDAYKFVNQRSARCRIWRCFQSIRKKHLTEVVNLVDVVWSNVCTLEEARKQYESLIRKQSYEYHQLKTITKWRIVRLYDANGRQIAQES